MNYQEIYKRIKINWWIIILLGGIHIRLIFAYIHQWGNIPIDEAVLFIFMSIIFFFIYIFLGQFMAIIDDNYVVFRSGVWVPVKIPVTAIKNISVIRVAFMVNLTTYYFDFVRQAVRIQLKNGIVYQIAIKNAERVKEEIEKRMLKTNNIVS